MARVDHRHNLGAQGPRHHLVRHHLVPKHLVPKHLVPKHLVPSHDDALRNRVDKTPPPTLNISPPM